MFFYRLVIDEALVSRSCFNISLTPRPIFLRPLLLALLHNWDFLPWLRRQGDIVAGLIGSFSEKTLRSATNMAVWSLQLCHWFLQVNNWWSSCLTSCFNISLTPRLIFLGPLCVALLHNWDFLPWLLRQRYCCWTDWVFFWEDHAFSYKDVCLIPSTLSVMFFSG